MIQQLTPARVRALKILAIAPGHRARYSNVTRLAPPRIYWQIADWLIKEGYAVEPGPPTYFETIELTDKGRELCSQLGIVVTP